MLVIILAISVATAFMSYIIADDMTKELYENSESDLDTSNEQVEFKSVFMEYYVDKEIYNKRKRAFKIRDVFATIFILSFMSALVSFTGIALIELIK